MDHLPTLQDPFLPPLEIAYLGDRNVPQYDNLSFTDFPTRASWNKQQLLAGSNLNHPPETVAAFIQQWLYFGVLSAYLGHTFPMQTLLEHFTILSDDQNRRLVTNARLEQVLTEWRSQLPDAEMRPRSGTVLAIEEVLDEVQRHVALYMCRGGEKSETHPMRAHTDISLSISALCVVLTRAKMRIWPQSRPFAWQHSEWVLSRMESAGWCPSDITMLEKLVTPNGMYFASLLRPRLGHKNHVERGCDRDTCNVMNLTPDARRVYQPEHSADCNNDCRLLSINEENLCEILSRESSIAVVRLCTSSDGNPELLLSPVEPKTEVPFVAISHVWVEGLGNAQNNALPYCQLSRIQSLVDVASGQTSVPFWLDTLCIPQDMGRPHLTRLRKNAVKTMDNVYRKSSCVLVLDTELASTRLQAPFEEQLIRFACSSWVRRLWTLNEAVLGTKVLLQFQDGVMDLFRGLIHRLQNHPNFFQLSQTLLTELADFPWKINLLRETQNTPDITRLWNACQFRSTSEHQDESMCLAILLGHDPAPIVDAAVDERWCLFLRTQKVFPKDLLFSKGPRVGRDGYRWAPSSFIRRPATQMATLLRTMGYGEATNNGLKLAANGFVFRPPQRKLRAEHESFWVKDQALKHWYRVVQTTTEGDGHWEWQLLVVQIQQTHRLGIILNQDLNRMNFALGVLVETKEDAEETEGSCLDATFLSTIAVSRELEERWPTLEAWHREELGADPPDRDYLTVEGTSVSAEREWCVG